MFLNGFTFDIEGDDLYLNNTKIWTIWLKDNENPDEKFLQLNPYKDRDAKGKFLDFVDTYDKPIIAGHYILGYDMFVLLKILDINFTVGHKDMIEGRECLFIDTLHLSQYINPDLRKHGIEAYGDSFGVEKIDYRQWCIDNDIIGKESPKGSEFKIYNPEMEVYCERDVDINILVLKSLWGTFCKWYNVTSIDNIPEHYRVSKKDWFLQSCQEFTGWVYNRTYGLELAERIEGMIKEVEDDVLPKLPPRKLKKTEEFYYSMPAKPFKKDGSFSSNMIKFIEKHQGVLKGDGVVEFYGKEYTIESKLLLDVKLPMELKDGDDLKEWFLEQGWKPTMWNHKKDAYGKPVRDEKGKLILTSPKIQEAGVICPNLEALDGDIPKQVVRFLSLRNRLAVLTSWNNNERLNWDGRIGASRTGITPTQRVKHSVID